MSRFNELTVTDVHRETDDSVCVTLAVPDALREHYRFVPGQYLPLEAEIDGVAVRRTYSICSPNSCQDLRVGIRQVSGGAFSTFANGHLEAGMSLNVGVPMGRFTAAPNAGSPRTYVGFAAGSGITPLLSMIASLLAQEPKSSFTLFFGNRNRAAIMFRDDLDDLKDRYLDRFRLIHLLSREGQDIDLLHGRLDGERIKRFAELGLFDTAATDTYFLCGPGDMIETARETLAGFGIDPARIKFERFTPAGGGVPASAAEQKPSAAVANAVTIDVRLDGATHEVTLPPGETSIIDAAHAQGIELPYSCKGGMCCTCRAKLVDGEAEMTTNYSLEPWELEAGFVLTCQLRPKSRRISLDFDAV